MKTRHEEMIDALKVRKYNSSFSESRRSLVSLYSFKVKSNEINKIANFVFSKIASNYPELKNTQLSSVSISKLFGFVDESLAGKQQVSGLIKDVKIEEKKISFTFECIAKRKLVIMSYSFILKRNNVFIHYLEYTLSDIAWENIKGRITRFYYIRDLKKRQKLFANILNNNNFKARRTYSLVQQIAKWRAVF